MDKQSSATADPEGFITETQEISDTNLHMPVQDLCELLVLLSRHDLA